MSYQNDQNSTSNTYTSLGNVFHSQHDHGSHDGAFMQSNAPRWEDPKSQRLPGVGRLLQESDRRESMAYRDDYQAYYAPVPHSQHPAPPNTSSSTQAREHDVPHHILETPLPDDDDLLPTPLDLVQTVARPVSKKAGARRSDPAPVKNSTKSSKAKGKQPAVAPEPAPAPESKASGSNKRKSAAVPAEPVKRVKGRQQGSSNFRIEDLEALLDIVEELLPVGGKGWTSVEDDFNEWAEENGRPERSSKSLESKYKQLAKTSKPTGTGEMPDLIDRAKNIESMMCEKTTTQDLDDKDIIDTAPIEISSDEEDKPDSKENKVPAPKAVKVKVKAEPGTEATLGPVLRRLPNDRLRTATPRPKARPHDTLLSNINNTLDPAAQAARAEERAARNYQTTQLLSLTSQLQQAQGTIEGLRRELAAAERRCDKFEMMSMFSGFGGNQGMFQPFSAHSRSGPSWSSRDNDSFPSSSSSSNRRFDTNSSYSSISIPSNSQASVPSSYSDYSDPIQDNPPFTAEAPHEAHDRDHGFN